MNFLVGIAAGLLSAIFFFLFASAAIYARTATRTANYTILLLLDEFAYNKQRKEFLALIESTNTKSYLALYHAVMAALEGAAKTGAARQGPLIARMWSINQSFLRTGRSVVTPNPTDTAATPPEQIGSFRIVQSETPTGFQPKPRSPEEVHRANVRDFETVHRFFKWYWAWRRRIKRALGLP
jgi:hypothetical protein